MVLLETLAMLALYQALTAAWSPDLREQQRFDAQYSRVTTTAPEAVRRTLLTKLADEMGDVTSLEPLWAIIEREESPELVRRAVRELAALTVARSRNATAGLPELVERAYALRRSGSIVGALVIVGLLEFGDERVVPLLHGCWRGMSQVEKNLLASYRESVIDGAVVEFFLQWIEDTDEMDFGHPAGAIARIAAMGSPGKGVVATQWRTSDGPQPVVGRTQAWWDKAEFARVIEPRLRLAYCRETTDALMPYVMQPWGIDPGPNDRPEQLRRASAAWERAAEGMRDPRKGEELAVGDAAGLALWREMAAGFTPGYARAGLRAALRRLGALDEADDGRPNEGRRAFSPTARTVQGWFILRSFFGPDPVATLRAMDALAAHEALASGAPRSSVLLSEQDFGMRLSLLVENAAELHDLRNRLIAPVIQRFPVMASNEELETLEAMAAELYDMVTPLLDGLPPDACASLQTFAASAFQTMAKQWRSEAAVFTAGQEGDAQRRRSQAMYAAQYADAVQRAMASLRETLATLQGQYPGVVAWMDLTPRSRKIIAGYDWSSPRV